MPFNHQEDSHIARLLAHTSTREEGFALMVKTYSRPLYWKIRGIVLVHEDADDILQNTWLKVWRSIESFEGKSRLSTWLYRIAMNEALDHLRKQKIQPAQADDASSVADRLQADPLFDGNEAEALLKEAIATLPTVQRMVFNMRYYDEVKYGEMSKILGTSEGALKASYHIAVRKISEYVNSKQT